MSVVRELQAAPAKAAMAEALSIDMHEMKAISPETEPEHSHATGMIIDLNDVVSNIVIDAERARMKGCLVWRKPPSTRFGMS